mgnify:CR=1 FL=1
MMYALCRYTVVYRNQITLGFRINILSPYSGILLNFNTTNNYKRRITLWYAIRSVLFYLWSLLVHLTRKWRVKYESRPWLVPDSTCELCDSTRLDSYLVFKNYDSTRVSTSQRVDSSISAPTYSKIFFSK